jgi:pimeloyl-ACP methyl ester carboxylesterase
MLMNLFSSFMLVLAPLLSGGWLAEWLAERRDRRRFPAPGKLVTAGGCQMHLLCSGERRPGQPLVLLECGMGSWSFYWRLVQPEVAKFGRVCAYDRPGFGWSQPGSPPRSASRIAAELHEALQNAGESGPYLLVGHSLGGIFVRQFARLFPQEVSGMLLVDSAHEDQLERMPWARKEAQSVQSTFTFLAVLHRLGILRLLGKSLLSRFASVKTEQEKKLFLATMLASRYFETSRDESLSVLQPLKPGERLTSLGDKPLIVIQAGGQPEALPRGYTEERWQQQRRAWDEIQQDLLKLSSNSRLEIAEKSIHTVQIEQPELVIEAIRRVLEDKNHAIA